MEEALKDVEEMLIAKHENKVLAPIRTVLEFPEKMLPLYICQVQI